MSAALRRTLLGIAIAIVVATPRIAAACAVCLGGTGGGTPQAFGIGVLTLSVLPLAMFGGIVFYLRRRAKAIEREASERRDAAPTRAASSPG